MRIGLEIAFMNTPYKPLIQIQPQNKPSALVISIPHSRPDYPESVQSSLATHDKNILWRDSDHFVDQLYQNANQFGATTIIANVCRYVIDMNRDATALNSAFCVGAPHLDNPPQLGLVAHKTTRNEQLLKTPLPREEVQRRINDYHTPFHNAVQTAIENAKREFGFCIHIDAHSMPSTPTSYHKDFGQVRADVVPGDDYGKSCSTEITKIVETSFTNHSYSVAPNNPYEGGYITKHYGNPQNNVHTIQLELNRKIYMNEERFEIIPEKFEKVKVVIDEMLGKLSNLKL